MSVYSKTDIVIPHTELNYEKMKELQAGKSMWAIAPEPEVFVKGVLVDMQSTNLIVQILEAIKPENKEKFGSVICQDSYKLANFLDKMWQMVK
jgi:hypothetical protein